MFKHCVIMCKVKQEGGGETIASINFNKYSYKIAMVVKSLSYSLNQTQQMIVTLNFAHILFVYFVFHMHHCMLFLG